MVTRIINADLGIPTPLTGIVVLETVAGASIWVMEGVDVASAGSLVVATGGQTDVMVQGNLLSTGGAGVAVGQVSSVTKGGNQVALTQDATINAFSIGISGISGNDMVTVAGLIKAGSVGIQMGQLGLSGSGSNTVELTETGSVQSAVKGIVDLAGQSMITVDGHVSAKSIAIQLGTQSRLVLGTTAAVTGTTGVDANDGNNTITNAGHITAKGVAVALGQNSSLVNSGQISGTTAVNGAGAQADVLNSGILAGAVTLSGNLNLMTNEGTVQGSVSMGGLNNTLINHGSINGNENGAVNMGTAGTSSSNNKLVNTGEIFATAEAVTLIGTFLFSNLGHIDSGSRAFTQSESDADLQSTFKNHGTIGSDRLITEISFTSTSTASTIMTNFAGGVIAGSVETRGSTLFLINRGTIDGIVGMSGGDDTYDGRGGFISSFVSGAGGNDRLISGTGDEELLGGDGNDSLSGNDGHDRLDGGAGNDVLRGGEGNDQLIAGTGNDTGFGGLGDDTVVGSDIEGADGNDLFDGGAGTDELVLEAFTVGGATVNLQQGSAQSTATGRDVVLNFENVTGTGFADNITGDEGANDLSGAGGADSLIGGDGRDTLAGDAGADKITGGAARDLMTGGAGGDVFIFAALAESGPTVRDIITDFTDFTSGLADRDRINLTAIDANTTLAGDQAFVSVAGGAFVVGSSAGKVRFQQVAGNTVLEMETNNDGVADMTIVLHGLHTITSSDYFL